jgi:hypothetical protein
MNLYNNVAPKRKLSTTEKFRDFTKENFTSIFVVLNSLVAVLLVIIIYFLFNPPYVDTRSTNQKIFDEVKGKVEISDDEAPIVLEIPKADTLKKANSISEEIYANVKDGDYFISLSDKIIIYRNGEDKVIYEGPSPAQIRAERETQIISDLKDALQSRGEEIDFKETPQLTAISDPKELQKLDADFYKDAKEADLVAVFPNSGKIVIYRSADKSIVKVGNFSSRID